MFTDAATYKQASGAAGLCYDYMSSGLVITECNIILPTKARSVLRKLINP